MRTKELRENFQLIFEGMNKILEIQEQLVNGIIALAKKEGLKVTVHHNLDYENKPETFEEKHKKD